MLGPVTFISNGTSGLFSDRYFYRKIGLIGRAISPSSPERLELVMAKHWSEVLACSCGMRFRTTSAETVHRHNFPALCRKRLPKAGETLVWTRSRDGEHDGKPTYEYTACSHDRHYYIVWAYDRGGSFGYSAHSKSGVQLTDRPGIVWARTLARCKAQCEDIERKHSGK